MTTTELVKVADGCYRTHDCGVIVLRDTRAKQWKATYRDVFGCKVVKMFATIGDVREFLRRN